ncbi:hypothetical protein PALB_15190 [Pseudoalteromonas luteoviolacea B = ATCC 29581]|nr:hypothetical protein PALB_15190 [Pseudoalteromonas luteoviolacea B = ATCC 29581]
MQFGFLVWTKLLNSMDKKTWLVDRTRQTDLAQGLFTNVG